MSEIIFQVLEQFETKSVFMFTIKASDVQMFWLFLCNTSSYSKFYDFYIPTPILWLYDVVTKDIKEFDYWNEVLDKGYETTVCEEKAFKYKRMKTRIFLGIMLDLKGLNYLTEQEWEYVWDLESGNFTIHQLRVKYGIMDKFPDPESWLQSCYIKRAYKPLLELYNEADEQDKRFFDYILILSTFIEMLDEKDLSLDKLFEKWSEEIIYVVLVTNIDISIFVIGLVFGAWIFFVLKDDKIIQSNWGLLITTIIKFLRNLLMNQIGKEAEPYFPFFITVFFTILLFNVLGLIPFNFCFTSQILVTFTVSFSVFMGIVVVGFRKQGLMFLKLFVPQNVPNFLLPFLVLIEVVSYISRTFSLAIRLFANMVAGHALLHILEDACLKGIEAINSVFLGPLLIIPIAFICIIIVLELGIALLQTYVFTILFCIYLNDSLKAAGH